MRFPRPARRVVVAAAAVGALVVGGAAYADGDPSASQLDTPAAASLAAVRVPSTTAAPPTTLAGGWPTKGPGTMLFPMNPSPRCDVQRTFGAVRSGGRTHEGIDIMATLGQQVYAVEDGVLYRQAVAGQSNSSLSGNGWNLLGGSGAAYAFLHLSAFAPGLQVGSKVVKGQLIGYVGDTGNPGPENYHLHFEVHPGGIASAAVDPYPLLNVPTACTTY
jgi:murein DD-endopeptidase MepM/ murein hydrolase activator NlpD